MKLKSEGFDWDEGNRVKCEKHGVSISTIERFFSGEDLRIMPDVWHSSFEDRFIAMGNVDGRYVFIVFTWRARLIRPVSARYMHKYEVEYYERQAD